MAVSTLTPDVVRVKDSFIKRMVESFAQKNSFKIDKTLLGELDSYLSVAKSFKIKSQRIPYGVNGPQDIKLIGAMLSKTQAHKDRVREIDIYFLEFISMLNREKKKAEQYLWDNYQQHLTSLRSSARQTIFLDSVLRELVSLGNDVQLVRDKAVIVLQNLTDTYWTLSKVQEIALAFIPKELLKQQYN